MAIFAVVENEIVINVIVAENQQIADEVIALTLPNDIAIDLGNNDQKVGIGWAYKNKKFIPPTPLPPTPPPVE